MISLTLGHRLQRPSGQPETVLFTRHEREFQDAVDALKAQSPLSLDGPPTLEEIVREYHSHCVARQERGGAAVVEMEDSILIAAADGRRDLVEDGLTLAADLVGKWPKARLPLNWVSADAWLEVLRNKADDSAALADVVNSQVAQHKLEKLKV